MRLTDLTAVELQRLARHMLRRYLDVRAGVVGADVLAPLLAPAAATDFDRLAVAELRDRVRYADLGPVTVLRLGPNRAYAAAPLRRGGHEGSEVVSVELEVRGERVGAVRIGEAETRLPDRAAQRADVPPVGPGQPVPLAPAYLSGLLGAVPADPAALDRWAAAAAVIDVYRESYGIDDAASAFGPAPTDPEQAAERQRAMEYVRAISAQIEPIEPQQERGIGRDRSASSELGR